jgi:hypothetical protein
MYLYMYKIYVNMLLDNGQVEILRKVTWWLMKVHTRLVSKSINVYSYISILLQDHKSPHVSSMYITPQNHTPNNSF